jgi:hypothetical protein
LLAHAPVGFITNEDDGQRQPLHQMVKLVRLGHGRKCIDLANRIRFRGARFKDARKKIQPSSEPSSEHIDDLH